MKVLLTGATGLFGPYVARALEASGHEATLVGLTNATDPVRRCDLTDRRQTEQLVRAIDPELVLHVAALTNVDLCERDPVLADQVNRGTTATLAALARASGSRLVLVSTDSVFDGARGGYREEDEPAPVNVYARSKLDAEHEVLTLDDGLAVRVNFFGRSARGVGLAEWLLRELRTGNEVTGFADVVFSPLHCAAAAAEWLLALAESEASGIVHLGSGDAVSKLDFALLVAQTFGFDRSLVHPGRLADGALAAARPLNTSLDSSRAASVVATPLPSVAEGVFSLSRDAG